MVALKTQGYWTRNWLIWLILSTLLIVFIVQSINIHSIQTHKGSIIEKADSQALRQVSEKAIRGDILDRNGEILATSLLRAKINIDPTILQKEFISDLAKALEFSETEFKDLMDSQLSKKRGRRYWIIKDDISLNSQMIGDIESLITDRRKVCAEMIVDKKLKLHQRILSKIGVQEYPNEKIKVNRCTKQKLAGVKIEKYTQRYYPRGASLAPLIGRLNSDGDGIAGIEQEFNDLLKGKDGEKEISTSSDSGSYFNPKVVTKKQNGKNIQLTIDANIQFMAYDAIKNSVKRHDADSGSAIILSPNGEILSMANYPADNPNDKSTYIPENYKNRILTDLLEPGSTMKPFTMLLALDQGKITATEDECFDVTKRIGHVIPTYNDKKIYKCMTVKKILQKSDNLGTVNVMEKLDKETVYETWSNLGFGKPLALIPSIETPGVLKPPYEWTNSDKRTVSYGYGPMNTNLAQLARAYLVFGNDGKIPNLKLINDFNIPNEDIPVFKKETVKKIAKHLDAVVSLDGSGYRARITGHSVAGKTGTVNKRLETGGYSKKDKHDTFFSGFSPVDEPKYFMTIHLNQPKKCYRYKSTKPFKCEGSNSASMVFQEAMDKILNNDILDYNLALK
jgi:cell division protein FtsI (penicillin-binding protein 3)